MGSAETGTGTTTAMPTMRDTVQLVRGSGYNGRIRVGGAPVTRPFAGAIGTDAGAVFPARSFVTCH